MSTYATYSIFFHCEDCITFLYYYDHYCLYFIYIPTEAQRGLWGFSHVAAFLSRKVKHWCNSQGPRLQVSQVCGQTTGYLLRTEGLLPGLLMEHQRRSLPFSWRSFSWFFFYFTIIIRYNKNHCMPSFVSLQNYKKNYKRCVFN